MPTIDEIKSALRASRAVRLGVKNSHGPLGLQHLAEVVARLPKDSNHVLSIAIRPETHEALERLASAESQTASAAVTPADVAAAIVEQVVSTGQF